ncbi:MAG: hypothetical protein IJV22_05320 [Bacteroidales bacterium]|nr:hypothetical protein [Bacteroidales bacterium]
MLCANHLMAQDSERPSWLLTTPTPGNSTYYYRVTHAEAPTYEKAYAKAFAMAIMESSWKLGVVVDKKDDVAALERGITASINTSDMQMRLPLNKVCEWRERSRTSAGTHLYVLWQVAVAGNIKPEFEPFSDCR